MKQCIFCREYKKESEFNREHIILESLGGKGNEDICFNVCKICNSSLGTRVDASLVNHEITIAMRYRFKIKGKHSIPNPFKKHKIRYADTPFRGELKTDKEGNIIGFRADHEIYKIGENTVIVGPKGGFVEYVNSQLKNLGKPQMTKEEILNNILDLGEVKFPHINKIEFSEELKKEYLNFAFPTMLKMAYEFCFMKLGSEYLEDHVAIDIRNFLMEFDYKRMEYYECPTDAQINWIEESGRFISISLFKKYNKIFCAINLYGCVLCTICMSKSIKKYNKFKSVILKIDI